MSGVRPADRCPGLLRPHQAEDGAVVRLRLPGGRTDGVKLAALSRLALAYGSADLQLTSRGGLQLRGLPPVLPAAFLAEVTALGLLPAPSHERVRNIAASPLTGIAGGAADVRGLVAELDRRLIAEPALADLPGRFLFVVDDGRGDVSGLAFDLGYQALSPTNGLILIGDPRRGVPVAADRAAQVLIGLAQEFLAVRAGAWHVADRPEWAAERRRGAVAAPGLGPLAAPLGPVGGAASVHVPLGFLTPAQAAVVARVAGTGPVVVTPWRGLVVAGGAGALPDLVATGLVAAETSAWSLVSACVGAPGCVKARADTRQQARDLVACGAVRERTHLSGCGRRCGAPVGPHVELVAAGSGPYELAR